MRRAAIWPGLLAAAVLIQATLTAAAAGEAAPPAITVTGSGEAAARPDTAIVRAGAVTEGVSAAAALRDNGTVVDRLFRVLTDFGVAEKDVQTTQLDLSPIYDQSQRSGGPRRIVGYRAVNQLTVRVREIATLGRLLDELVQQSANRLDGVQFVVDQPTALLDAARRQAMADAQRKAELFAEAAGVALGPVIMVREEAVRMPQPKRMSMIRGAAVEAAVPLAAGEITFTASVTVSFAIR
jgi:uncharacterized protein YggE